MLRIGPTEMLMVLAVVVILFGPTQIPKLTRMFGEGIRNFREGMSTDDAKKDTTDKADKDAGSDA